MLEASGRYRIRYADVLRSVGHHLDSLRMRAITVVELDEGFLLKGQMVQPDAHRIQVLPHAVMYTNEDIEALIEQAYVRRGASGTQTRPPALDGVPRYEDLLRGLGYYCDQQHWHDIIIVQTREHYLLKGARKGMANPEVGEVLLDNKAISELLAELRANRRESRRRWLA